MSHPLDSENVCIYAIQNPDNGKIYVGKSQNPAYRTHCHFLKLMSGKHSNKEMQFDYDNRKRNFCWFILQTGIPSRSGCFVEQDWMIKLGTYDFQNGYNTKDSYFYRNDKRIGRIKEEKNAKSIRTYVNAKD